MVLKWFNRYPFYIHVQQRHHTHYEKKNNWNGLNNCYSLLGHAYFNWLKSYCWQIRAYSFVFLKLQQDARVHVELSCRKLGANLPAFHMSRYEGRLWKESPMRTSRMFFLLYTSEWLRPVPTTSFYVNVIVWWRYGTKKG